MRAFGVFPIGRADEDFAVAPALPAMKFVNRHEGKITGAAKSSSAELPDSNFGVKLAALPGKLAGFFFHSLFQRLLLGDALLRRIFPHVLRYLHAAKVRAAHGTKMRRLRAVLRQGLIMEFPGRHRIK